MYTWGQLKTELRARIWPVGEAENLVKSHDAFFLSAIIDLQTYVPCLQQDNTDVHRQCETFYNCGMTILDAPRGIIKRVSIIDKINPETHKEDPTAEDDWCSEVGYGEVDFCHVHRYMGNSRTCGSCLPIGGFFALPFWGFRPRYPTPTDEGLPPGLAPLDLGFHYPQESTDRTWGRAGAGVWAKDRGKIYIAPWIQTTETVIVKWDGIKRTWTDADPIDPDPLLADAIEEYVRWKDNEIWVKDFEAAAAAKLAYEGSPGSPGKRMMLIHQCREETRARECEPSHARQASTQGGQTSTLFYNDEQSASASCPDGQTGNPTSVTVPAGTVGSNISVADANQKALAQAQTQATAQLNCVTPPVTYWNAARTFTATCEGEEGAPTPIGTPQTVTIQANTVSSTISQDDADAKALALAVSQANGQLSCTFFNKEITYSADCPSGQTGPEQSATVPAGTYSSTISQSDADQKATTDATNQVAALLAANCVGGTGDPFWNTTLQVSAQAFSTSCMGPFGGTAPGVVNVLVTIPPNIFSDPASQAGANQTARAVVQVFANNLAASRAIAGQCGTHLTTYPNP